MVSRVVELREPIKCFLIEKKSSDLAAKFSDTEWLSRLCTWPISLGNSTKGT